MEKDLNPEHWQVKGLDVEGDETDDLDAEFDAEFGDDDDFEVFDDEELEDDEEFDDEVIEIEIDEDDEE